MRHPAATWAGIVLLGPALVFPAAAQQPQPLGRPVAEFEEPFSRVSGLRELADGRVIVSDQREKLVQVIDMQRQTARRVGREGTGPGEYAMPLGLLAMPNDQTLLVDLVNRRFLMIKPDGTPAGTISPPSPAPQGTPGGGRVMMGGLVNARAADSRGRLYFQDLGFQMGGTSPDSVPVVRWMPEQSTTDTAGWVKGPATSVSTSPAQGGGMQITRGSTMAWAPLDQWGVAADGRVAKVTPSPYQVTWYDGNGRATSGPAVPYTPIRVTEAHKQAYREQQQANPPTVVMMGGGGAMPAPQMPEPTFPETLPPFTGMNAVLVSPEGEVWVLRTRAANDHIPVYDLFDGSGRLVKKVSLARNSRVAGFGRGSVYVVRTDEDDLEYLQKFARP